MFEKSSVITDPRTDFIGQLCGRVLEAKRHTTLFKALKHQLEKAAKRNRYIVFAGHPKRYHVQRVGESVIFLVPKGRRGHLRRFRGRYVRVFVISRAGGFIDRVLMAGPVAWPPTAQSH